MSTSALFAALAQMSALSAEENEMQNPLYTLDKRIVDPTGQPVDTTYQGPRGIDLVEAEGGGDALQVLAAIADLKKRNARHATLVIAPGEATEAVYVEVHCFNHEAYKGRPLTDRDRERITAAVKKRLRKMRKRAK